VIRTRSWTFENHSSMLFIQFSECVSPLEVCLLWQRKHELCPRHLPMSQYMCITESKHYSTWTWGPVDDTFQWQWSHSDHLPIEYLADIDCYRRYKVSNVGGAANTRRFPSLSDITVCVCDGPRRVVRSSLNTSREQSRVQQGNAYRVPFDAGADWWYELITWPDDHQSGDPLLYTIVSPRIYSYWLCVYQYQPVSTVDDLINPPIWDFNPIIWNPVS
jgi:hypothetical protein